MHQFSGRGGGRGRGGGGRGGRGGRGGGGGDMQVGRDRPQKERRHDSDDDFADVPMPYANHGGDRTSYDEDIEFRRMEKQKDRKKARREAKKTAKEERIQRQNDWAAQNKQRKLDNIRAQREERDRAKKAKRVEQERKAKKEARKAARKIARAGLQPDAQQQKPHVAFADSVAFQDSTNETGKKQTKAARAPAQDESKPSDRKPKVEKETPTPCAYVVPAKRQVNAALTVTLTSLCNKLTVTNVDSISLQLADLFRTGAHARSDVVAALADRIDSSCISCSSTLVSTSALAYVGVIRSLELTVGVDVAAPIVERLCISLEEALAMDLENSAVNASICIAHLMLLHVCDGTLPLSMLRSLLQSSEDDVLALQCALNLVKVVGSRLCQAHPAELNELVAESEKMSTKSIRHDALISLLRDIALGKNRSDATHVDENALSTVVNCLCNQLNTTMSTGKQKTIPRRTLMKALESTHVLHVSWEQCVDTNKAPRWFNVTVAPVGSKRQRNDGDDEDFGNKEDDEPLGETDADVLRQKHLKKIRTERTNEKAALQQRFNSENKRRVFDCLTECSDDTDAFHKLSALLHRGTVLGTDVFAVTFQCCVQEPQYNPFYPTVMQRLLSANKKMKNVLQFAAWDRFKAVRIAETPDVCGYINLACAITHFFRERMFGLGLLRGLDLDLESHPNTILFVRILLLRMMLDLPARQLTELCFGMDSGGNAMQDDQALDDAAVSTSKTAPMRTALFKIVKQYFSNEATAGKWIPALVDVVGFKLSHHSAEDADEETSHDEIVERRVEALPDRIRQVRRALNDRSG